MLKYTVDGLILMSDDSHFRWDITVLGECEFDAKNNYMEFVKQYFGDSVWVRDVKVTDSTPI